MKSKAIKIIGITLAVLIGIVFIFAKVKRVTPLSWGHNKVNVPMFSNQAINGYDAVAYFTENKAIVGIEEHVYNWNNTMWYFSTKTNKDLFATNPEKYAPEYGGYCSFAISKGFTANSDPNTFEIINNKLFLFSDENIKSDWMSDQENNLNQCNLNW